MRYTADADQQRRRQQHLPVLVAQNHGCTQNQQERRNGVAEILETEVIREEQGTDQCHTNVIRLSLCRFILCAGLFILNQFQNRNRKNHDAQQHDCARNQLRPERTFGFQRAADVVNPRAKRKRSHADAEILFVLKHI